MKQIVHYDYVEFIPGIQGWAYMKQINEWNVPYQYLRTKNHVIISTGTG